MILSISQYSKFLSKEYFDNVLLFLPNTDVTRWASCAKTSNSREVVLSNNKRTQNALTWSETSKKDIQLIVQRGTIHLEAEYKIELGRFAHVILRIFANIQKLKLSFLINDEHNT